MRRTTDSRTTTVARKADSSVGLILVHGIGNQRPDVLASEMAVRLDDSGSSGESPSTSSISSSHKRDKQLEDDTQDTPIHEIFVHGLPIMLLEANWAKLSYPDNPPEVRLAHDVIRDVLDTVSRAFLSSAIASAVRRFTRRKPLIRSFIMWGSLPLILTLSLLWVFLFSGEPKIQQSPWVLGAFGAFMLPWSLVFVVNFMRRKVKYRNYRLRHAARIRRVVEPPIWFVIYCLLSFFQFPLFLMVAELLLFFAAVAALVVAFDYLMAIFALAFRGIGWGLNSLGLQVLGRWTYRLGWVLVVLPVHTVVQATKATGNLISIVFTERGAMARLTALLGIPGVFLGFLLLAGVCELLLLPVILLCLDPGIGMGWLVMMPIYLVGLKGLLPAIDLIIDIGNYHLAPQDKRRSYYQRLERAAASLLQSGCKEIHVLAHSLGTVITYDWLRASDPDAYPIGSLHTIGSPLDKFWYVDHSWSRRHADKEGLANHLSRGWTNYWAWSDLISGKLDHYSMRGGGVANKRLRWLGLFFISHVRYWNNPVVIQSIRDEIAASVA